MILFAAPVVANEDFLSKNDRRLVQQSLTQQGFDTRGVDGVFGKGTREAIADWQRFNGYPATGRLTEPQYAELTGDGGALLVYQDPQEDRDWRQARAVDDAAAYRAYLNRYPAGRNADEARQRLDRKYLVAERRERERDLRLNSRQRREIEQRLARAGYYPGSINGKFDRDTRNAIRDYRRSRGLEYHAFLDGPMLRSLVNDTGGVYTQRQNGEDNIDVGTGIALGALIIGGAILIAD